MTIIVAYRDDARKEVWIGSDSRVTSDRFIWPETAKKWLDCGRWVIGVSGSAMIARVVRDKASDLGQCETAEGVADMLMAEFKERDFKRCDHNGPPCYEQDLIIATKSEVFSVAGNGIVAAPDHGFAAVGSGDDFAYGAAYAIMSVAQGAISGDVICRVAVEAACQYSSDCGGKIVVEKV